MGTPELPAPPYKYKYILQDARFLFGDGDRSTVFEVCDTKGEARRNRRDYGDDTLIVRCIIANGDKDLIDEKIIYRPQWTAAQIAAMENIWGPYMRENNLLNRGH